MDKFLSGGWHSSVCFVNTYLLDGNLSVDWWCPPFEQPGPRDFSFLEIKKICYTKKLLISFCLVQAICLKLMSWYGFTHRDSSSKVKSHKFLLSLILSHKFCTHVKLCSQWFPVHLISWFFTSLQHLTNKSVAKCNVTRYMYPHSQLCIQSKKHLIVHIRTSRILRK